mmetsp:Transcript_19178/g.56476  ORF Transcript_19178/g.56476 Transcript_19178/m.56476 type:complete len:82 (-) Transcript_19178:795-1040(-)
MGRVTRYPFAPPALFAAAPLCPSPVRERHSSHPPAHAAHKPRAEAAAMIAIVPARSVPGNGFSPPGAGGGGGARPSVPPGG